MKKTQVKALLGAAGVSLALMGGTAKANDFSCPIDTGLDECYAGVVSGKKRSFEDWTIGSLAIGTVSDVFGYLATAGIKLKEVTLTSLGNTVSDSNIADGITFDDLASGDYKVSISGKLTGDKLFGQRYGLYAGGFTVVPQIPEPETYALVLAGLLTIGFVARRRQGSKG